MSVLEGINKAVWGLPTVVLILSIGLWLTVRSGFLQIMLFPKAIKAFWKGLTPVKTRNGQIPPFQALCTALAATVGTGNLAGVAGAIAIGGPGAVFWMWVSAFLGMTIKFAEAALSVRYRQRDKKGNCIGGTMYVIQNGMGEKWKWLAGVYCFFGAAAAFGVGNATQINTLTGGIGDAVLFLGGTPSAAGNVMIGVFCAVMITSAILGGVGKVGKIAEKLVPFASLGYIFLCLGALLIRSEALPGAFLSIVKGAFSPESVTGGAVGSAFIALRTGISRGIFTNEAGMGTAGMAHGSAGVSHPAEQGLLGIMEVFLDTIVICTMTALVILSSGIDPVYGLDEGILLTNRAFSSVYGDWVRLPISLFLACFAFATVLGWGVYGGRCVNYLLGEKGYQLFVYLQGGAMILSSVMNTGTVWALSEIVNGLMVIPNVIALGALRWEVVRLVMDYKRKQEHAGHAPAGFTQGSHIGFHPQKDRLTEECHRSAP